MLANNNTYNKLITRTQEREAIIIITISIIIFITFHHEGKCSKCHSELLLDESTN